MSALWDTNVPNPKIVIPQLGFDTMINIAMSILGAVDLTYILIPVMISWHINMSTLRRIVFVITVAVSLGIVAVCIFKVIYFHKGGYNLAANQRGNLMACLEQNLCITLGCIPAMLALLNQDYPVIRHLKRWATGGLGALSSAASPRGVSKGPSSGPTYEVRTIGSKSADRRAWGMLTGDSDLNEFEMTEEVRGGDYREPKEKKHRRGHSFTEEVELAFPPAIYINEEEVQSQSQAPERSGGVHL